MSMTNEVIGCLSVAQVSKKEMVSLNGAAAGSGGSGRSRLPFSLGACLN